MKPPLILPFLLLVINFVCISLPARNTLTGTVLNDKDHKPVGFASVYIDGTTKGVYTDSKGCFSISDISFPCQLVVSHIAYDLRIISIEETTSHPITIWLIEKTNKLVEVAVSGKSNRKQNINDFKEFFLGKDKWGTNAMLKNDSVLVFSRQTDTLILKPNRADTLLLKYNKSLGSNYHWSKDSSSIINYIDVFKVKTNYPLHIELPLLGYDVYVDLESFVLKSNNKLKTREYRTYNRFVPFVNATEHQKILFEKNRKEAYYNSSKHFCKSLFDDKLKENGYLIAFDNFANNLTKLKDHHFFEINQYIHFVNSNEVQIIGLKDKQIDIYYFCKYKGKPIDLTLTKGVSGSSVISWGSCAFEDDSYVTFKSDTCIIRRDGTIPDNNLMFGGKMATKCGGALLPNDDLSDSYQDSIYTNVLNTNNRQFVIASRKKYPKVIASPNATALSNNYLSEKHQDSTATNKLTAFAKHFSNFSKEYPQEKVYLHFDNIAYYLGETIWFKGYVVTAEQNELSPLSKTLYVELITVEGDVVETKKLKIEAGQCHGQFQLPDSLFSGFFEVRAYTRYSLNEAKDYQFSRVFPVYNKPNKAGDYSIQKMRERAHSQRVIQFRKEYEQKGNLSMSFYPEGGNLVTGLTSKVAFKAKGKDGENAIVFGAVYDLKGTKVAEIEAGYQGMGIFEFTPDSGKFTAKVQYNNREYSFDLPNTLSLGYVMTVDNTNDEKIDILIQRNPKTVNIPLGLSISCRGKMYGFEQVMVGNENALLLSFPKKMLPTGVSQITLFNADGEVLCERLVFINQQSQLKIDMTQRKHTYQPFDSVEMKFQLNDPKGKPVETTFSIAVRDAASTSTNPYTDNIYTNLLLSSEVKGYIENPGYYFSSNDATRQQALDLLMLTQGWSRYVWKQMAGVTPYEVKYPIEESLVVEGKVLSLNKKKPKLDVDVMMTLMCDSTSQRGTCLTDKDGKFNFALQDFNGKSNLILQTKEKGKLKENVILLDRAFSPELKLFDYLEKTIQGVYIPLIKDTVSLFKDTVKIKEPEKKINLPMNKKSHLLGEVTVKEKRIYKREGEGLRDANIVIDIEKAVDQLIDKGEDELTTILNFIMHINPYFFCTGVDGARYKGNNVMFVLNNNVVKSDEDKERLATAYSNEIETVTINEKSGTSILYDPSNSTGNEVVIFIYTYKNLRVRTSPIGMRKTKLQGYAYVKEFYNPRYDDVHLPNEKDYRRILYWNPDVKTDENGKATINFYNNSSCKTMKISAETVTENGVIGVYNK